MSKEYLEAWERLNTDDSDYALKRAVEDTDIVQNALQRLEAIENSNPSDALLGLRHIKKYYIPEPCSAITYDYLETIKQALLKAQKEHNSVNLLMKELDCKDMETLRKYTRCGYQTFRNAKGSQYGNIIIDEAQEPKQYLKWEDLEFGVNKHKIKVKLNDSLYVVEWFVDGYRFKTVNFYAYVYKGNLQPIFYLQEEHKQFFNDLHLERVEE